METKTPKNFANALKAALVGAAFFSILTLTAIPLKAQELKALDRDIADVIGRIQDAVVTVEARLPQPSIPVYPDIHNRYSKPVNAVVGSGLLIDSLGHILTVLSLVDGYDNFMITMGPRNYPAHPIGFDRSAKLAVLKIDAGVSTWLEASPFPPFTGRLAISFGRAFGNAGYPALGIIAGRRNDGSFLVSGSVIPGLLGGGVFDLDGQLVGIIISGSVSEDAAESNAMNGIVIVPASDAFASADKIICCGNREAGYLGVKTTAIEMVSPGGEVLGEAVVVTDMELSSPAAKGGIRIGDVITRVASHRVTNDRELQRLISSAGANTTVEIDYMRSYDKNTAQITLASYPDNYTPANNSSDRDNDVATAIDLSRRLDSMRTVMFNMQNELEHLLDRINTSR